MRRSLGLILAAALAGTSFPAEAAAQVFGARAARPGFAPAGLALPAFDGLGFSPAPDLSRSLDLSLGLQAAPSLELRPDVALEFSAPLRTLGKAVAPAALKKDKGTRVRAALDTFYERSPRRDAAVAADAGFPVLGRPAAALSPSRLTGGKVPAPETSARPGDAFNLVPYRTWSSSAVALFVGSLAVMVGLPDLGPATPVIKLFATLSMTLSLGAYNTLQAPIRAEKAIPGKVMTLVGQARRERARRDGAAVLSKLTGTPVEVSTSLDSRNLARYDRASATVRVQGWLAELAAAKAPEILEAPGELGATAQALGKDSRKLDAYIALRVADQMRRAARGESGFKRWLSRFQKPALRERDTASERAKAGFRWGVGMLAFTMLSLTGAEMLGWEFNSNYQSPELGAPTFLGGLAMVMSVAVLAPVLEELLFRAGLYKWTRDLVSRRFATGVAVWASALFNAVFFTVLHETQDPVLIAVRVLGALFLVFAYQKHGYLASTTAHATYNFALTAPALATVFFGVHPALAGAGMIAAYLAGLWVFRAGKRGSRLLASKR